MNKNKRPWTSRICFSDFLVDLQFENHYPQRENVPIQGESEIFVTNCLYLRSLSLTLYCEICDEMCEGRKQRSEQLSGNFQIGIEVT